MNKIENITNSILPEDIEKLWQAIDKGNEWAEIVMIGIYTGFRVRELLEIKKENVNLETRIIIGGGNKTLTSKDRHVPIHKAILPLIEKRMHNESEWLFSINGSNISLLKFSTQFSLLMKEFNGNCLPHCMRHTFLTMARKAGLGVIYMYMLGMNNRVFHFTDEMLVVAIDRLPGR